MRTFIRVQSDLSYCTFHYASIFAFVEYLSLCLIFTSLIQIVAFTVCYTTMNIASIICKNYIQIWFYPWLMLKPMGLDLFVFINV